MPRVIHFDIPADDPQRAIQFYEKTFGWKFNKWDGPTDYWLVMTGEGRGIDGGLLPRQPGAVTTNTVDVPSVDEALATIQRNGGSVAMPKMAIQGVGWLAYCKDPEGNMFGVMQADPAAK